jgi:AcrR family transcriptional regulator
MLDPVARPLGRPKAGDSAETRQRLLLGARDAFARHGFDATTNRQIASAAGVTTAAIYHYFTSKTDVYLAVLEALLDEAMIEFTAAVAGRDTLAGQFNALLDRAVMFHRADPSISSFIVAAMVDAHRHPELHELMRRSHAIADRFYIEIVDAAVERGELDAEMAVPVADLMISMLAGLARFSAQTGDGERLEASVGALKRMLNGDLLRR